MTWYWFLISSSTSSEQRRLYEVARMAARLAEGRP
jgi:hypothetical protein